MSDEHKHHDHASGEHTDLDKLRVLLPHWIEHNEEHAASFEGWAAKARVLGQEETVQRMAACNQALTAALYALEG